MDWQTVLFEHFDVKLVTVVLIVAAWIDGKELRVPNWITFPMILTGWLYCFATAGMNGLGYSLLGTMVGLLTLLPLYSVGGMGAGDVKLMAGMGAWLGVLLTAEAFVVSVIVGAIMAVVMAFASGKFMHHYAQFLMIWDEWRTIRNPEKLAAIAKERKPSMRLLPYGIPICVGSVGYFIYKGLIW